MTALFLVYILLLKFALHDFYVSICVIKVLTNQVEVAVRVFKDDLEKVINTDYDSIQKSPDKTFLYFSDNLIFYTDKCVINCHFSILEDRGESVLISGVMPLKEQKILKIKNTIFCDVFPGQQNIIHFYNGEKVKTLTTDARQPLVKLL